MIEIEHFYSPNFDVIKRKKENIKFLVFHYTGMKTEKSALKRLTHRGAKAYDGNSGDGSGILVDIPRKFFGDYLLKKHLLKIFYYYSSIYPSLNFFLKFSLNLNILNHQIKIMNVWVFLLLLLLLLRLVLTSLLLCPPP